ncbi:hypothetical protein BDW02DRAFT_95264 [Decorospora gaudefroyi]|uniref:Uncharacterized protein n=1 Tax=Decorospora gaudefroyi TaxID=184978 RepID=A0A6A5JZC7_9PLEO|nr:hypothetical protein BDW02DRAFT_95264 [Decorospora gaudefroyi]
MRYWSFRRGIEGANRMGGAGGAKSGSCCVGASLRGRAGQPPFILQPMLESRLQINLARRAKVPFPFWMRFQFDLCQTRWPTAGWALCGCCGVGSLRLSEPCCSEAQAFTPDLFASSPLPIS